MYPGYIILYIAVLEGCLYPLSRLYHPVYCCIRGIHVSRLQHPGYYCIRGMHVSRLFILNITVLEGACFQNTASCILLY